MPPHTSPRIWEAYRPYTDCEEASVKLLEIDCAQPLEVPMEPGSHYGIVMMLASIVAGTSVCSAIVSLVMAA
jgi:hypothetical protein